MDSYAGPSKTCSSDAEIENEIESETGSNFSDIEFSDEDIDLESAHETEPEVSEISDSEYDEIICRKRKRQESESNRSLRVPSLESGKFPELKHQIRDADAIHPISFWNCIFNDEMIDLIVKWTNVKFEKARMKYTNSMKSDFRDCAGGEVRAFLGLLMYTAVFRSNHENLSSLFATDGTGREIFRTVMSSKRFSAFLLCLQFDNPEDRENRKITEKAAEVRDLLELFNKNCQNVFSFGTNVTVDEMLIPFRGKCSFRIYMPNKNARYGLKLQCLADASSGYVYNAYLYSGKNSDGIGLSAEEKKYSIPTQSVLRLCKPIYNNNCNVTADKCYSSAELVQVLKDRGLTFIGNMKRNKKEIPSHILSAKSRGIGTLYEILNDMTFISHVRKATKDGKAIILISSMHQSKDTDSETGTQDIIEFYNATKGAVDRLDAECAEYSSSRRTRHWAMAVFHRICDMSAINSYILYQSHENNQPITKFDFMKVLAKQLVEPHLKDRLSNTRIPRDIRLSIEKLLGVNIKQNCTDVSPKLPRNQRKCCYLCVASKRRKTSFLCTACWRPVCLQCSEQLCLQCGNTSNF